ncbi:MAG TPA: dihydrofolate reductase family protein [Patescibacteria group bacterium]|nr:dihydrofolate reductase family protein [Patescibacteria group bacterium]
MSKIFIDITMSLDGFIAGPDISSENPMGKGGLRLHNWMFGAQTEADKKLSGEQMQNTGAVIIGRRMYETAISGPWGNENPFAAPVFVLTEAAPEQKVAGFTYVTDGIQGALSQAKKVAGDKNIWITGANVSQQYLKAGYVDELHIHIAPVLFMAGTKLFENLGDQHVELEVQNCIQTPGATHIVYKVIR